MGTGRRQGSEYGVKSRHISAAGDRNGTAVCGRAAKGAGREQEKALLMSVNWPTTHVAPCQSHSVVIVIVWP